MPGAGKTYWGRRIAAHYGLPFIDLDEYISSNEGKSVAQLIQEVSEETFRDLENKYLIRLIGSTDNRVVIACGGGTPCFSGNMRTMKMAGIVVYLEADLEYLYSNVQRDGDIRPLLGKTTSVRYQMERLLQLRRPYYEQAHYILQAKDISLTTFDEILGNV
ncbi:shikimate kinase [Nemorincola caseinilytica]|uniref:Shikimate kinase n=2 Tax=Nemorincola caseinilytica TaxID=2054315 RepID=A0ABP8N8T2_9BACT